MKNLVQRATTAAKTFMKTKGMSRAGLFFTDVENLFDEQKADLIKEIAKLEKKVESATTHKTEFCLNLNVDKLKDSDLREEYVIEYVESLINFDSRKVGSKSISINDLSKELKKLKAQLDKLNTAEKFLGEIEAPELDDYDEDGDDVIIGKTDK